MARPPPNPDTAATSSPSPGCRILSNAAVVSPSATAAFFCLCPAGPMRAAFPFRFRPIRVAPIRKEPPMPALAPFSTISTPISTAAWSACSGCCGSSRSRPTRPMPRSAGAPPNGWSPTSSRSASRPRCATRPAIRWWSPITTATARMCCSTATTTCSRSIRSICGRPILSRRRSEPATTARRSSPRAARPTTRAS